MGVTNRESSILSGRSWCQPSPRCAQPTSLRRKFAAKKGVVSHTSTIGFLFGQKERRTPFDNTPAPGSQDPSSGGSVHPTTRQESGWVIAWWPVLRIDAGHGGELGENRDRAWAVNSIRSPTCFTETATWRSDSALWLETAKRFNQKFSLAFYVQKSKMHLRIYVNTKWVTVYVSSVHNIIQYNTT